MAINFRSQFMNADFPDISQEIKAVMAMQIYP
jgi:hypothetical protein